MSTELYNSYGLAALRLAKVTAFIFPPFRALMKDMEEATVATGLPDACRVLIERSKIKVLPQWDNRSLTEEVLRTKPVIIVGNHDYFIEPFVLSSQLPSRKDMYVVAADIAGNFFGGEIKKHTLPVVRSRDQENNSRINSESIRRATELLQEGHSIAIFPKPSIKDNGWKTGVGRIVDTIDSTKQIYLVMADVQNVGPNDILKVPIGVITKKDSLTLKVRVSAPISIVNLGLERITGNGRQRAEQVTRLLENTYNNWRDLKMSTI